MMVRSFAFAIALSALSATALATDDFGSSITRSLTYYYQNYRQVNGLGQAYTELSFGPPTTYSNPTSAHQDFSFHRTGQGIQIFQLAETSLYSPGNATIDITGTGTADAEVLKSASAASGDNVQDLQTGLIQTSTKATRYDAIVTGGSVNDPYTYGADWQIDGSLVQAQEGGHNFQQTAASFSATVYKLVDTGTPGAPFLQYQPVDTFTQQLTDGVQTVSPQFTGLTGDSQYKFEFSLTTNTTFSINAPDTGSWNQSADFSHTAVLRSMELNDAPVTGLSGHTYRFNPVPEPASLLALGMGALAILRRAKKKLA